MRRSRQFSTAAVFGLALASGLGAAACRAETLADAIALAYRSNPDLLAQRAALRALDENYNQARAGYGPTVNASVEGAYQAAAIDQQDFFGGKTTTRANAGTHTDLLSITQPLYTGGQTHAQV